MLKVEYFTNDNFKILAYLYNTKGPDNRARITQQEVADALDISRATVNRVMSDLKTEGYIEQDGNHVGRYILTNNAIGVVETFRSVNDRSGVNDIEL